MMTGIPLREIASDLQGIRAELSALVSARAGDTALGSQLVELCTDLDRIIQELRSR